MAAISIQDQVAALLSRRVAEGKVRGVPSPEVEAVALFDSIAINLATHPRALLYIFHLARNGLLKAISDELKAIDALRDAVTDLGNVSYAIKDTLPLEKARVALTQVESQDRLISSNAPFGRYTRAVQEALGQLSANVVAPGASELTRPAPEAEIALPTLYKAVQAAHEDVLHRLYALSVGVENFLQSPVLSILGISTVQSVKEDIESMLADMRDGGADTKSRDFAIRLLAGKAALQVLGKAPALSDGSPIALMWGELQAQVEFEAGKLLASPFGKDLTPIDRRLAGLTSAAPSAQIAEARRLLESLRGLLDDTHGSLQEPLPSGTSEERRVVNGILSSLEERGYTRAAAMLLRCQIAEMFELDWQTASFAGTLMKAGSDIARTDLMFDNRERGT